MKLYAKDFLSDIKDGIVKNQRNIFQTQVTILCICALIAWFQPRPLIAFLRSIVNVVLFYAAWFVIVVSLTYVQWRKARSAIAIFKTMTDGVTEGLMKFTSRLDEWGKMTLEQRKEAFRKRCVENEIRLWKEQPDFDITCIEDGVERWYHGSCNPQMLGLSGSVPSVVTPWFVTPKGLQWRYCTEDEIRKSAHDKVNFILEMAASQGDPELKDFRWLV
jgi:hypothetical protein